GRLPHEVIAGPSSITVNHRKIPVTNHAHPKEINWDEHDVKVVIEASGKFKTTEDLNHHLSRGVEKVILTVPPQDEKIKMVVMGVNENILEDEDKLISNASCTTNNAAPMLAVIQKHFGVKHAYISTIHSYTADQSLHDRPHRDLRRSRAAATSIIPTTTGAAKALTKVFPDLHNVIGGCGIRVPVPNGSLTDMTLNVNTPTSIEEVNAVFKEASNTYLKGI